MLYTASISKAINFKDIFQRAISACRHVLWNQTTDGLVCLFFITIIIAVILSIHGLDVRVEAVVQMTVTGEGRPPDSDRPCLHEKLHVALA